MQERPWFNYWVRKIPGEGIGYPLQFYPASLVPQMVKNLDCNAGDLGLIPGSRRFPGEENGYPLQYSYLKNSRDRGAWGATVHGVTKNWTRLSD